jgi:hypothetical protein
VSISAADSVCLCYIVPRIDQRPAPWKLRTTAETRDSGDCTDEEQAMRKVLRGFAKAKDGSLILKGTVPILHSKEKLSPSERRDKRHLVRRGATIFKKEA